MQLEVRVMSIRVTRAVVIGALMISASLVAPPSEALAPQTFPLVCKGTNLSVTAATGSVRVRFTRFPRAAGVSWNDLWPGSCAWVDRPVGSGEPNTLCYIGSGPFNISWVTRPTPNVDLVFNDGKGCLRTA